eukprot:6211435-Pleurochrysis_carterae.AAC.1
MTHLGGGRYDVQLLSYQATWALFTFLAFKSLTQLAIYRDILAISRSKTIIYRFDLEPDYKFTFLTLARRSILAIVVARPYSSFACTIFQFAFASQAYLRSACDTRSRMAAAARCAPLTGATFVGARCPRAFACFLTVAACVLDRVAIITCPPRSVALSDREVITFDGVHAK